MLVHLRIANWDNRLVKRSLVTIGRLCDIGLRSAGRRLLIAVGGLNISRLAGIRLSRRGRLFISVRRLAAGRLSHRSITFSTVCGFDV
jgi:hypothetical protein